MTLPLSQAPESAGFLSAPFCDIERLDARFAVLGIPHGVPYPARHITPGASAAPRAIRERSARFGRMLAHHDFDLGCALGDLGTLRLADCGDVPNVPGRATQAVRRILDAGAMPIVLGGDDSTTALALRGFEGRGPLHVLQIDAHIDWRQERYGEPLGFSSTMRRASEMDHVGRIIQVGLRLVF